jgi:hypothetical protein
MICEHALMAGRWTTQNRTLMAKFANFSVHGGPPLAYISAQLSPSGQPYYAGIMHHIERWAAFHLPHLFCMPDQSTSCSQPSFPCSTVPSDGITFLKTLWQV